jgi:D-amino-acid oxidase
MNKKVAVVGAGISGLATAYTLVQAGYAVTVIAAKFSPNITSNKAAAFWFPYHIRNDKRGISWCQKSYDFYQQLSQQPITGISMQPLIKAIKNGQQETDITWYDFMPIGSYQLMEESELPKGYIKAYKAIVPLIETQIFLPYLQQQLKNAGVLFVEQAIDNLQNVAANYDVVINCTALGARQLCSDDKLMPVRGQVALLSPKSGLPIFLDNESCVYIVPRKDAIIVGGTYEEGIENETTEPATIERLLNNVYNIYPNLKEQQVIGSWAGLRPFREEVRLKREGNIIHNYGHGGSGFTLAFGCAEEVLSMM